MKLHPECERMHARGYCVCVMVECVRCERNHPPSKPCEVQPENEPIRDPTP